MPDSSMSAGHLPYFPEKNVGEMPRVQRRNLFHYTALRDADVVAAGVLHQIHHFVGLPDHVVRRFWRHVDKWRRPSKLVR
jgi:hypothetical protein